VITPVEGDRNLLVFTRVLENGVEISREFASFARPKHLSLRAPTLTIEPEPLAGNRWRIAITTDVPSLWTRLDLGTLQARPSDNFFHLMPGVPFAVEIALPGGMTAGEVRANVRACPLMSYWMA